MKKKPFKICGGCETLWETRDEFLKLEKLYILGFQAHFLDISKSLLLFNHSTEKCETTLGIPLVEFLDLIPGLGDKESAFGQDSCRGLCLTESDLSPCDHPSCKNVLVREFIQKLVNKKRKDNSLVI